MGTITTSVSFRDDIHNRVNRMATKRKKSASSIVNSACLRFLETEEEKDIEIFVESLDEDEINRLEKILKNKKGS